MLFFNRIQKMKSFFLLAALASTLTNCSMGTYMEGTLYQLASQPLSLNQPELKTCIFDPQYSIVHFPMYHFPSSGHYTEQTYEEVAQSQFQLLHTIISYNRSPQQLSVFDENISTDHYNKSHFSLSSGQSSLGIYRRIDGQVFYIKERLERARQLFLNGFPIYYEYLSKPQKDFLFNMGASLTLYLLKEIPQIHKVISPESFSIVKANLLDANGMLRLEGNNYWIFDFRENELRKEVLHFFQRNKSPQSIILIAYGAKHDLSNEFLGYPFQSGHSFCLDWLASSRRSQPVLP